MLKFALFLTTLLGLTAQAQTVTTRPTTTSKINIKGITIKKPGDKTTTTTATKAFKHPKKLAVIKPKAKKIVPALVQRQENSNAALATNQSSSNKKSFVNVAQAAKSCQRGTRRFNVKDFAHSKDYQRYLAICKQGQERTVSKIIPIRPTVLSAASNTSLTSSAASIQNTDLAEQAGNGSNAQLPTVQLKNGSSSAGIIKIDEETATHHMSQQFKATQETCNSLFLRHDKKQYTDAQITSCCRIWKEMTLSSGVMSDLTPAQQTQVNNTQTAHGLQALVREKVDRKVLATVIRSINSLNFKTANKSSYHLENIETVVNAIRMINFLYGNSPKGQTHIKNLSKALKSGPNGGNNDFQRIADEIREDFRVVATVATQSLPLNTEPQSHFQLGPNLIELARQREQRANQICQK